jgi:proteic killer suppression protein
VKKLGPDGARKLRQRLDDLARADNLAQMSLLPGKCEALKGDRIGQFSLRLLGGNRLIFQPDHNPVPRKSDGGIDWQQVTSILIIAVEDYHK